MAKVFDQQAIMDFIKSNNKNLKQSLGIILVEEEIRKYIIQNFLKKLNNKLIYGLKDSSFGNDWEISFEENDYKKSFCDLLVMKKKSWNDEYSIRIQPQSSNTNNLCYGVASKHNTGLLDQGKEINRMITDEINSSRFSLEKSVSSKAWPYCPYVKDGFRNWGSPDTLYFLVEKEGSNDALSYFYNRIMSLAEITYCDLEKIIESVD